MPKLKELGLDLGQNAVDRVIFMRALERPAHGDPIPHVPSLRSLWLHQERMMDNEFSILGLCRTLSSFKLGALCVKFPTILERPTYLTDLNAPESVVLSQPANATNLKVLPSRIQDSAANS